MVLGVCVEVLYSRSYDGAHIAPTELIVGRFGGSNTKEQGLEHLKSGESVPQRFKMKWNTQKYISVLFDVFMQRAIFCSAFILIVWRAFNECKGVVVVFFADLCIKVSGIILHWKTIRKCKTKGVEAEYKNAEKKKKNTKPRERKRNTRLFTKLIPTISLLFVCSTCLSVCLSVWKWWS